MSDEQDRPAMVSDLVGLKAALKNELRASGMPSVAGALVHVRRPSPNP